ncbi:MAG: GNAT family N-acetyltransferase [Candidatus Protochlamydia sp.]|nr:GNAT family N-acetyltransferase [Candidatus Protochlamydia sp.]
MLTKQDVSIKLVPHGSDAYHAIVALREEVLRAPLGLTISSEELEREKNYFHIACYLEEELCGTAMMVPMGEEIKIQRVAVKEQAQGHGIGSELMNFCEMFARNNGFRALYCHARDSAIKFYAKNNFVGEGEMFDELGFPHWKMRRLID